MCSGTGSRISRKVADHVGDSAVEEYAGGLILRDTVRAHFPSEHEFSKENGIDPRQGAASDCHLVLDDGASSLDRSGISALLQGVDERTLARARPTG
jgi:hypothetical protein